MNAKLIRECANAIAREATNIEREVESTSELGQLVNELYRIADEIADLSTDWTAYK